MLSFLLIAMMVLMVTLIGVICRELCRLETGPVLDPRLVQDMDRQTCEQMRESGWSEEEIEQFMTSHDSLYFPSEKK